MKKIITDPRVCPECDSISMESLNRSISHDGFEIQELIECQNCRKLFIKFWGFDGLEPTNSVCLN